MQTATHNLRSEAPNIPHVLVLSETDGRPYYAALEKLAQAGQIKLTYRESSVIRLLAHDLVRKGWALRHFRKAFRNLIFRLQVPFVRDAIVINGMGPYDFRIVWYGTLSRRNFFVNHTSWPYWGSSHVPRRYGALTTLAERAWRRHLAHHCDALVAVLSEVAQSVENFCPGVITKTHTLPHSVEFSPASMKPKCDPSQETRLKVLYVGKLIPEKGLSTLNFCAAKLPAEHFQFSIVGGGAGKRDLSQTFQLPNVAWHGHVADRNRLQELFSSHDVLLVPSQKTPTWEELFGIVVIEGLRSGLCVMASPHVGPRNLISSGVNGLLVPEDQPCAWVAALATLHKEPEMRKKLGTNARRSAEKYTTEVVAESWLQLLRKWNQHQLSL